MFFYNNLSLYSREAEIGLIWNFLLASHLRNTLVISN